MVNLNQLQHKVIQDDESVTVIQFRNNPVVFSLILVPSLCFLCLLTWALSIAAQEQPVAKGLFILFLIILIFIAVLLPFGALTKFRIVVNREERWMVKRNFLGGKQLGVDKRLSLDNVKNVDVDTDIVRAPGTYIPVKQKFFDLVILFQDGKTETIMTGLKRNQVEIVRDLLRKAMKLDVPGQGAH
ncbi:MAG: hypothetical protein ACFFCS_23285 [Candidatus Hodarchaeota archaeon]